MRLSLRLICTLCIGLLAISPAAFGDNLIANGNFADGAEGWLFYVIEMPSEISISATGSREGANHALVTGGVGYLHSPVFDVTAGGEYTVSAWIRGSAQVNIGLLWWKEYTDVRLQMADPHWTQMEQAAEATDEWRQVTATFTAPDEAARAYVRFVVSGGEAHIDGVSVTK